MTNFHPGNIILISLSYSEPAIWSMDLVIKVFGGSHSLIRHALVCLGNKEFVRSITKLILLLIENLLRPS